MASVLVLYVGAKVMTLGASTITLLNWHGTS